MSEIRQGPRDEENLEITRRLRILLKVYHQDVADIKNDKTELISRLLSECVDARKRKDVDHWPIRFASIETIKLVGKSADGVVRDAPYRILLPKNPRDFITTLWEFLEEGKLPPEAEIVDPAEKERAAKEGTERQATERDEKARREQERKAREDVERQAKEKEQREREKRERDEAEARKPENAFSRRILEATSIDDLKNIRNDLDTAFSGFTAHNKEVPEEYRVSGILYKKFHDLDIPARAASLLRGSMHSATRPEDLRSVYANIISCGLFRDERQTQSLSQQGESLLGEVFTEAVRIFEKAIGEARDARQLASIGRQIKNFFGGSVQDSHEPVPKESNRRPTSLERARMAYTKQKEPPHFLGPLSEAQRDKIQLDGSIIFKGPSEEATRIMVFRLANLLEAQQIRISAPRAA